MASTENSPKVKKKKESKKAKEDRKNEKDEWHVKTLEEIMEEKRRRKDQKKGSRLEEGELDLYPEKSKSRSPPREQHDLEHDESEGSEKAEEEFDALQIQPPQASTKKDSKSHKKEEKIKKHSRHGNRDRERRHKRKRSHSKEGKTQREHSRSRPEHKEQRRERREDRHEDAQVRPVSHDRAQQREVQQREVPQRDQQQRREQGGRHRRDPVRGEQESREQSRMDRDRLERIERERDRDLNLKKRRERPVQGMERYEKVPGGKESSRRRRGEEEQWRRRDAEGRHDTREYPRHEKQRWVERERSPLKEKLQPLPLMEIKVDRPKPRSPSGKHEYAGSSRDTLQPAAPPVPLMELKVDRPSGKKRSPVPGKQSKDDSQKDEKERRREKRREVRERERERKEEQVEDQPKQEEATADTAEHESSDSDDSSSDDSDDSGESGDDSEAKSGSEASSDDSDSDDDSDDDSDEEEEEEEGATQTTEEKKEEGEHASSEDDSGSDGSDSDSESDSESDSDKESGSGSENEVKEVETEKPRAKKEKNVKPKVENHEKKKKRSPEPSHRKRSPEPSHHKRSPEPSHHKRSPEPIHHPLPQKSKFERDSSPSGHEDNDTQSSDGDYLPESPPKSPVEFKEELPPYLPAISGCRNVEEFVCLNKIEEGTYGVVYRAKEKRNDEVVALKRLKMEKEKEGFPITSLREINTLLKAQHPNIVTVREIVVGSNMDKIYIVMDYVEHDLKSLMETMKQPFTIGEVKCLMLQLLRGVHHLHDNWILHRDLKTSNLLLSHRGVLKIGDFGLAREYGSPLKMYTPIVVTLWYRAPELLLGTKEYTCPIDMWSVGCIFAEFITMKALFPGRSEVDQLNRIFKELGTPSEKIWPGYNELPAVKKMTFAEHPYNNLRNRFGAILTDLGFELMNKFLTYNPSKRITAEEAVRHSYFQESPLPIEESMFPTWPAKSEMSRATKAVKSPKPPEGGFQYGNLGDEEDGFRLTLPTHGTSVKTMGFSLKF